MRNYRELIAWQKAMELVDMVDTTTTSFPRDELYCLAAQMKRAAVSIPSNIAEGQGRRTTKDFAHFLYMAYGSLRELETQTMMARRQSFIILECEKRVLKMRAEAGRLINGLINAFSRNTEL
jgi:four helix bundle protein